MFAAAFPDILGRQDELQTLQQLFAGDEAAALLVEGEAGIGKTTLWQAGLELARERGFRVLAAGPSRAQAGFAYGALADLACGALERLNELPDPQRRALEQALLLEEHEGLRLEPRAVATAFAGLLRLLAEEGPLLVAVDDIQWLDRASAQALEYALPRFESSALRVLLALRLEETGRLRFEPERAFPAGRLHRLVVRGLSAGALHRLIRERLGIALIRPTLQRVHEHTGGNPFFALEMARALEAHGTELVPGEPLPVPTDVQELVRQRLRRLPAPGREALLAAAMQRQPCLAMLESVLPDSQAALEEPLLAGVVELSGDQIRFCHPLFASGIYNLAAPKRRRRLHALLAEATSDTEERALHLALAAEGPDETVAVLLEQAAERACARGAGAVAAELYAHSVSLTPAGEEESLKRRWIEQGECLLSGGDEKAACVLLKGLIERVGPSPERAWLCAMLAIWESNDFARIAARMKELLPEARGDPGVSARIVIQIAGYETEVGGIASALRFGRRAHAYARESGDADVLVYVLTTLGHIEAYAGLPTHLDLADRLQGEVPPSGPYQGPYHRPRFIMSLAAVWAGQLKRARALLEPICEQLRSAGNDYHLSMALPFLVDLEWRAGNWRRAADLAEESRMLSTEIEALPWLGLFARTLVAAGHGETERARELAREGIRAGKADKNTEHTSLCRWLLGFVELSLGDVAAAARRLLVLAAEVERFGYRDPGTVPLWGDAVESLVETGALDEAEKLTRRLERMAPKLEHPYREAIAPRCRGLVASAKGEHARAIAELEDSTARFEQIGMPFEQARSLLALGRAQRRAKKRGAARRSLSSASALFESLPAPLWQAKAEEEMKRIGGRTPGGEGELTASEERVARLVAQGLSNKEVAARLFVTVRTVEAALTRIYAKLGLRSRSELTAFLAREEKATPAQ